MRKGDRIENTNIYFWNCKRCFPVGLLFKMFLGKHNY